MSETQRLPVLRLTGRALLRAARSVLPLAGLYIVPWFLGTITLIALSAFRYEQFGIAMGRAHWAGALIWAPFGALITVLAARYLALGERPNWRVGVTLGQGFGLIVLIQLLVFQYDQFAPGLVTKTIVNALSWPLQALWFGTYSQTADPAGELTIGFSLFAGLMTLLRLLLIAMFAALAADIVWPLATGKRLSLALYGATLKRHLLRLTVFLAIVLFIAGQLSALAYFLVLEVTEALSVSPWPQTTGSPDWREQIWPLFLYHLAMLPPKLVAGVICLCAINEAHVFHPNREPLTAGDA
jgi:hypothetical protein